MVYYQSLTPLRNALDAISGETFSRGEPGRYRALVDAMLWGGDHYMLLADYAAYVAAQARVDELFRRPADWAARAILNVAGMGPFSADRTIRAYAESIWHVTPARA